MWLLRNHSLARLCTQYIFHSRLRDSTTFPLHQLHNFQLHNFTTSHIQFSISFYTTFTMSYMIQFPNTPLPADIGCPPFAIFAVHGRNISESLPPKIPLKMVLHFAPAVQKWVLPYPEGRPSGGGRRTVAVDYEYVGINIHYSLATEGILFVINRMSVTIQTLPCLSSNHFKGSR